MLKKMSIRKLMVATLTLFILLILYLMPDSIMEKKLDINHDNVEYVYSNNLEVIYLLDSNDYVARTKISINNKETTEKKAKELIEGLIIDGNKSNIIPNGFRSIIPSGTNILDISLDNKTITINFSKEILDINEKYEEKMIEAIIYTLTSIENVDNVIIKVDNKTLEKLPNSGKKLPQILDKSFGINKVYDITSMHNIDYFTLYYVNSFNDYNGVKLKAGDKVDVYFIDEENKVFFKIINNSTLLGIKNASGENITSGIPSMFILTVKDSYIIDFINAFTYNSSSNRFRTVIIKHGSTLSLNNYEELESIDDYNDMRLNSNEVPTETFGIIGEVQE